MAEQEENGGEPSRRKRHGMLKMYYGIEENAAPLSVDPCDINGAHFDPDLYLNKLIRELSLTQLLDEEHNMIKQIKAQDSQMQTLVYDNYNKFISATDTIRKMKTDFKKMEDEMEHLAANMASITDFSSRISTTLQGRRERIMKLSSVHLLLKKLQFLFELPTRLNKCIEMESYSSAVSYYMKAQKILHQYEHMPSFQGIHDDCVQIVSRLADKLHERFHDKDCTPKHLADCVDLLLQLGEPADVLCDEFLAHVRQKLDDDLGELEKHVRPQTADIDKNFQLSTTAYKLPIDVLEFVDIGCNGFLGNICLVIASYNDMFLYRTADSVTVDEMATKKLVEFVHSLMEEYFSVVQKRIYLEKETGDNTILVRALDRFHRRLQAMNKLLPDTDFSRLGIEIVSNAAEDRVKHYLQSLKQHLSDCLSDIRQNLTAPRLVAKPDSAPTLATHVQTMSTSIVGQIKSVLSNLQAFISPDITFALKPYFLRPFCSRGIRENLVVAYFYHIIAVCKEFCDGSGDRSSAPPTLLLILSRLCLDLQSTQISYILTLTEEQFLIAGQEGHTPVTQIRTEVKNTAQILLNHYVRLQGLFISQMLRKSVETRDWLNTIEPRNVRAVMKRVIEDITSIDSQVGQLFEEGLHRDRSNASDSSRRTHPHSQTTAQRRTNTYTPSLDNSLMSNIHKLFSEKIEIFTVVDFSKVSILTGIVKISLKTLLECIRVRTFGRFGLQQIQVDTHYLQLYLWRFVSDENIVQVLLDEIVCSAVHRCLDAVLMEQSVIALICERG